MPTDKTYDRILAYLKGLLSSRQRHDLEKEMMHDVFEEEAFEGLSQLSAAEFQTDMDKINNRLQNRINHHKKRDLGIFLRLAAGMLLLAGLTGILYIVFRAPSANLMTNEKTKIETPNSVAPSAPLMEVQSAPVESIQKVKPAKSKKKEPIPEPMANADEPEAAYVRTDTVSMSMDYLAQEEVVLQDNTDKKMKSLQTPSKNETVPGISIRGVQGLQGKAAGVQVSSESDDESLELYNKSTVPELSKPIPPGGSLRAFKKWVNDRLDYPSYKEYPGKQKVAVELTVHADGSVSDIRVKEGIPDVIRADLKKVISQSPPWKAALSDNNPVDSTVEIRFVITIE